MLARCLLRSCRLTLQDAARAAVPGRHGRASLSTAQEAATSHPRCTTELLHSSWQHPQLRTVRLQTAMETHTHTANQKQAPLTPGAPQSCPPSRPAAAGTAPGSAAWRAPLQKDEVEGRIRAGRWLGFYPKVGWAGGRRSTQGRRAGRHVFNTAAASRAPRRTRSEAAAAAGALCTQLSTACTFPDHCDAAHHTAYEDTLCKASHPAAPTALGSAPAPCSAVGSGCPRAACPRLSGTTA